MERSSRCRLVSSMLIVLLSFVAIWLCSVCCPEVDICIVHVLEFLVKFI